MLNKIQCSEGAPLEAEKKKNTLFAGENVPDVQSSTFPLTAVEPDEASAQIRHCNV